MAYYDGHLLAEDEDFQARCGFCAEVEGWGWMDALAAIRKIAASPGFSDAYAYALATGVQNPGRDQSVISDAQVLAAIQAIRDNETAGGA
jgi:hypothetical protein